MELRTENVTRYIMPLREGGSLPALAEADDEFKYVVKFRGAGHGTKALIAELVGGEIARALGFRVPELVFLNLDEAFGRTEGDEEIQDLLQGSRGLNLGLHFLSGALTFDPVVTKVGAELASRIVWLDAFLTNVDRTFRNTNMLIWHKELWLIDHGALFPLFMGELAKACRKSVRADQRSRAVARSFRAGGGECRYETSADGGKNSGDRGFDSRRLVTLERKPRYASRDKRDLYPVLM